jgi:hypothetical protein
VTEQPKDSYEQPSVQQLDAEDSPAVTAAGGTTDGTTTITINGE